MAGKLMLAFSLPLLLLLVAMVLGQTMRGQIQSTLRDRTESRLAKSAFADQILHDLQHLRQMDPLHTIALSEKQMDEVERERSELIASLKGLHLRYGAMISSPREKELLDGFFSTVDNFIAVTEETINLSKSGRKAEARRWINERVTPVYMEAETLAHSLRDQAAAKNWEMLAEADRIHAVFGSRMVVLTALGVAIALLLYVFSVRRITRPLEQLRAAAEQVAAGRMDVDVAVKAPDEIGQLADSFSMMSRSLRQRFEDMKGLVEVGRAVSPSLSLDEVLQVIVHRSRVLLSADHAGICLWSEGDEGTEICSSTLPSEDARYEATKRESEVHLSIIHADRTPMVAHNVAGFATALYVPMVAEERAVGAMAFFGQDGWLADEWRLEMAGMLAQQAGVATENARLHMNLREGCLSTISALVAAVEAKDSYTGSHCDRLADYGVAVARHMGLTPAEVEMVHQACLLHDSGKIGIRDDILLKPGRLNESEYTEIRKHPVIGAGIVESASFLKDVGALIRHHHEWYDGRGYPDGLKGEEIPLGARIVAVVDAYEAMTSDRPYRRAMSHRQAVEELRRCAGSQFDPAIVEAFLAVLREDRQQGARATG